MLEMQVMMLKGNIEHKLNMIKISNPLYYHQFKQRYERLCKVFKKSGYIVTDEFKNGLEELLEGLDDIVRGED